MTEISGDEVEGVVLRERMLRVRHGGQPSTREQPTQATRTDPRGARRQLRAIARLR